MYRSLKLTLAASVLASVLVSAPAFAQPANTIFLTDKNGQIPFPILPPNRATGAPGSINNMTIGGTTPGVGSFTAINGPSGGTAPNFIITGGTSSTSASPGAAARLHGGLPGATGTGGDATVRGGIGGSTSGDGGLASLTGGAGTAGNAAGGLARAVGGAGQGSAAGGAAQLTGGAGGATGAGGAAQITGGAGGATSGLGGAVAIAGGVGTAGNSAGGAASITGGAGQGTAAGGVASLVGGASGAGATGNGAAAQVTGGAALSTNGNGGSPVIAGGAKNGSGIAGAVILRTDNTILRKFPAAATAAGSATLTVAQLLSGIILATPGGAANANYQLPDGTAMDAAIPDAVVGDSFDFTLTNVSTNASETATLTTNTGWTITGGGSVIVQPNNAATTRSTAVFRARKTGTGTYQLYLAG